MGSSTRRGPRAWCPRTHRAHRSGPPDLHPPRLRQRAHRHRIGEAPRLLRAFGLHGREGAALSELAAEPPLDELGQTPHQRCGVCNHEVLHRIHHRSLTSLNLLMQPRRKFVEKLFLFASKTAVLSKKEACPIHATHKQQYLNLCRGTPLSSRPPPHAP